jgi:hypothetical protein
MAKKKRKSHQPRTGGAPRGSASTEDVPRSVRAERKELVRREREAIRKRVIRNRVIRGMLIYTGGALAISSVLLFFLRPQETASAPLPGVLTSKAPWPANTAQLADRLDRLELPAAGTSGTSMHIHSELQVFLHGTQESVPAGIGLAPGVESPLHTHETDGVIHVESETPDTFTLGEFFDVWGVRLTSTCLGGYCSKGNQQLRAYVNGELAEGSPRAIALEDEQVIVLTFGKPSQEPDPIPSTFDWSGLTG